MPGSNPGLVNGQVPSASDWNGYFGAKADYSALYVFASASPPTTGHVVVWTSPVTIGDGGSVPVASVAAGTGISVTGGPTYVVSLNAAASNLTNGTTGSGAIVLATSPTLVSPALGTPTALTLTNAIGLPLSSGVTGILTVSNGGTGSGNASPTALDNITGFSSTGFVNRTGAGAYSFIASTGSGSVVLATSPTLVTPALGTPSAIVLTNATGLPVASGISGLGTGVAAWLATPSSANLAAAVTDETGTGALVFGTSPTISTPTLVTPILGVAAGTSLALGGATIGGNAMAVTGTTAFGGFITFATDNTYDIGAAAASRPRAVYVGTTVNAGTAFSLGTLGDVVINRAGAGSISLTNGSTNTFNLTAGASNLATFSGPVATGGNLTVPSGTSLIFGARGFISPSADGVYVFNSNGGTNSVSMTVGASNLATFNGTVVAGANGSGAGFIGVGGMGFSGLSIMSSPSNGVIRFANSNSSNVVDMTIGASSAVTFNGNVSSLGQIFGQLVTIGAATSANAGSAGGNDSAKFVSSAYTNLDATTAGSSTFWNSSTLGAPTLTATNARTYTNANGLYVAAPVASTNVTATNLNAIYANGNITSTGNVRTIGRTVTQLGSASSAGAGSTAWVTDATQTFTSANFGTTVTGGGSNGCPVVSDGTNWKIG